MDREQAASLSRCATLLCAFCLVIGGSLRAQAYIRITFAMNPEYLSGASPACNMLIVAHSPTNRVRCKASAFGGKGDSGRSTLLHGLACVLHTGISMTNQHATCSCFSCMMYAVKIWWCSSFAMLIHEQMFSLFRCTLMPVRACQKSTEAHPRWVHTPARPLPPRARLKARAKQSLTIHREMRHIALPLRLSPLLLPPVRSRSLAPPGQFS